MSTQQQLVHQITDLAMAISLSHAAIVNVEFSSAGNHLRVTSRSQIFADPAIDECVELSMPDDATFTQRRVEARLRQIITTLQAIERRGQTPPPVAA